MGAWGAGLLEDDTALDFLEQELLPLADPRPAMEAAFRAVLEAKYVDYDMGHGALVSAAVIRAALRGEPLKGMGEEGESEAVWLEGLSSLNFSSLRPLAAQACRRVATEPSELCELWAENDELFEDWLVQSFEGTG